MNNTDIPRMIRGTSWEIDCFIYITRQPATYQPDAVIIEINFRNLPLYKIVKLTEAGGREQGDPADWMLAEIRLIQALRSVIGNSICSAVSQTATPFVISAEVTSTSAEQAMAHIAAYLDRYDVNCDIVHLPHTDHPVIQH